MVYIYKHYKILHIIIYFKYNIHQLVSIPNAYQNFLIEFPFIMYVAKKHLISFKAICSFGNIFFQYSSNRINLPSKGLRCVWGGGTPA